MGARVTSVARSASHDFSKSCEDAIVLEAGLGVAGDSHNGTTVKHRSRVAKDPTQPNVRQVHLLHEELFAELAAKGFTVRAGDLGENVLTAGLDILGLPQGTRLRIGADALIEITGLRNPCKQIEAFQKGLLAATLDKRADGSLVRKTGVMAIVLAGGRVRVGDAIEVTMPPGEPKALEPV